MIKEFLGFFRFERNQLLTFKIAIIPLILLIFALGFVQKGLTNLNGTLEKKDLFQNFEKKRIEQFYNYRIYGVRGFRLFFSPSPISIFFINSAIIPDMNAFTDSTEQLNIYNPLNTSTIFDFRKNWFKDYSGILLFFGTILSIIYGFQPFNKKTEYFRFLSTITSRKKIFWNIFFARGLLLFLILFIFMASSILLIILNGFIIPINKYILAFLLICFLLLMFAFSVGLFCGTMKVKLFGKWSASTIWAVFIFFIPTVQDVVITNNAKTMTPIHQLEMEKLIIFMNWEKMMIETEGIMKLADKPTVSVKKKMLDFKQNELKKIQKMEEDQIAQLESNKRTYQYISSFFPTIFYQSVNNEISSRGFNNLVDFCKYALQQKIQFIEFIIEKEYFSNYSKIEQFNNGKDNIYNAEPGLPDYFPLGIFLNLLWIVAFTIPSYYHFKKKLLEIPENKAGTPKPGSIKLNRKSLKAWFSINPLLYLQLYFLLSNFTSELKKRKYDLEVYFRDQNLNMANKKQNFLALCHPKEIPQDFKVTDFIIYMMDLLKVNKEKRKDIETRYSLKSYHGKTFSQLDLNESGRVLLSILDMKHYDIYLLNDVVRDMPVNFSIALRDRINELVDSGASVLFLYSNTDIRQIKQEDSRRYYMESDTWFNIVESLKAQSDTIPTDN